MDDSNKNQNLHTHTTYCDGALSVEEMILAAMEKGCGSIGFSEHSHVFFDDIYSLSPEATRQYVSEVDRLKSKYDGRIEVFLGLERDSYSDIEADIDFDYIIGSVHYINQNICVDAGEQDQKQSVDRFYAGDFYAFIEDYFAATADVIIKTGADIVGHFDLVTKFNLHGKLFDETHPRYIAAALGAMDELLKHCKLFEVNSGAMYRFGKPQPYPSAFLLKELQKRGGQVIRSSDSHDAESICYNYDEMRRLLISCGFKYEKRLTKNGFADAAL